MENILADRERETVLALIAEARELAREGAEEVRAMAAQLEAWKVEVRDG